MNLITFIILTVAFGIYWFYSRHYIRMAEEWYVMAADYESLVNESEILKKPISTIPARIIETNNFSVEYDPENPDNFFKQLNEVFLTINVKYNLMEDRSILFNEDDWKGIASRFDQIKKIEYSVRIKEWHLFGVQ